MEGSEWLPRALLTAGIVGAIVCSLALMRWGWVRRARRQATIGSLPSVPSLPSVGDADVSSVEARYLGANRSGDWLDRIVVHGLGVPSAARVWVQAGAEQPVAGIWLVRDGAGDIFIPADAVVGARHDRAAAGRAQGPGGVLVITWQLGDDFVDVGLRIRDAARAEAVRVAVSALAGVPSTSGEVA